MLVAARVRHIAWTRWGRRKYLDMDKLYEAAKKVAMWRDERPLVPRPLVSLRSPVSEGEGQSSSPAQGATQNQYAKDAGHYRSCISSSRYRGPRSMVGHRQPRYYLPKRRPLHLLRKPSRFAGRSDDRSCLFS
jgi:hypothetical protein